MVAFGVALGVASGDGPMADGTQILTRFAVEAIGGGLFGLLLGWAAMLLMGTTEEAHLELIISLALATGAFSLANALHMSGPIAVVVAGLTMGVRQSRTAITRRGHAELMSFWSLVDEVLNALLFLLIGFEVLAVAFRWSHAAAALVAVPLSVGVRGLSVFLATIPLHFGHKQRRGTLALLTWGGAARRHLGGAGARPAGGSAARLAARGLLRRGGVQHRRAGPDDRAGWRCDTIRGGGQGPESPSSLRVGLRARGARGEAVEGGRDERGRLVDRRGRDRRAG